MTRIKVTLTPDEMYQAGIVGLHRHITCVTSGRRGEHFYGKNKDHEWFTHIGAACAELAVAKHLNVYWTGGVFDGKRADCDVGNKQVRYTTLNDPPYLMIYEKDKPFYNYILVSGRAPDFFIEGWANGGKVQEKGKDHEWWKEPKYKKGPSWWVPAGLLKDLPE